VSTFVDRGVSRGQRKEEPMHIEMICLNMFIEWKAVGLQPVMKEDPPPQKKNFVKKLSALELCIMSEAVG
jgi:hypothetical protein